jgi:hypothetical protein
MPILRQGLVCGITETEQGGAVGRSMHCSMAVSFGTGDGDDSGEVRWWLRTAAGEFGQQR